MPLAVTQEDIKSLVDALNFAEKVERSPGLIKEAYEEYGDRLVVANSLGKDSCAVWHLAKCVSPGHTGFYRYHSVQTKGDHRIHASDGFHVSGA